MKNSPPIKPETIVFILFLQSMKRKDGLEKMLEFLEKMEKKLVNNLPILSTIQNEINEIFTERE